MSATPWVVCLQEGLAMRCKRCQTTYKPTLPISINLYVALIGQFEKDHKYCQPSIEELES